MMQGMLQPPAMKHRITLSAAIQIDKRKFTKASAAIYAPYFKIIFLQILQLFHSLYFVEPGTSLPSDNESINNLLP